MSTFKLIIAGSRGITDYQIVRKAVSDSRIWHEWRRNLEIVSGMARGVDALGVEFAKRNKLMWHGFPADWDNLKAPGALIKYTRDGKAYNAKAGHERNIMMGRFADGLVAVWDGHSAGTKQMIEWMKANDKWTYVHIVGEDE